MLFLFIFFNIFKHLNLIFSERDIILINFMFPKQRRETVFQFFKNKLKNLIKENRIPKITELADH